MKQILDIMPEVLLETDGIILSFEMSQVKKFLGGNVNVANGGYTRQLSTGAEYVTINPLKCTDTISMLRTLFHELGHATGHAKRLSRKYTIDEGFTKKIDYDYWLRLSAIEEVTAELIAAKCLKYLGVTDPCILAISDQYVEQWSSKHDVSITDLNLAEKDALAGFKYIRDNWIKAVQMKINTGKKAA